MHCRWRLEIIHQIIAFFLKLKRLCHSVFDCIRTTRLVLLWQFLVNHINKKVKKLHLEKRSVFINRSRKLCDWSNAKYSEISAEIVIFILPTLVTLTMYYFYNLRTNCGHLMKSSRGRKCIFFNVMNNTQSDSNVTILICHEYAQYKFA